MQSDHQQQIFYLTAQATFINEILVLPLVPWVRVSNFVGARIRVRSRVIVAIIIRDLVLEFCECFPLCYMSFK